MVNREIIIQRLTVIKKYLKYLKKLKLVSFEEFELDEEFQIIIERSLQIIGQSILDLGNHIIAENEWDKPQSYKDIITILKTKKVINTKYSDVLAGLISLRNILVHDYVSVDVDIIYHETIDQIHVIEYFIDQIEKLYIL